MLVYLFFSLLINTGLLLGYRAVAKRTLFFDQPGGEKGHGRATLTGAGLIFGLSFAVLAGASLPMAALAVLAAASIGFVDDLFGLPVWPRLIIYTIAAFLIAQTATLNWAALLLAALFLLAWANAYNFMDGINGMATVYGLVLLLSLQLLPKQGLPLAETGLMGALLAFALFNFRRRALCFAGDAGSIGLSLALGCCCLQYWSGCNTLYLFALPALYAVDTFLTLLYRLRRRQPLLAPHRTYLYELIAYRRQVDHRLISLAYGSLQAIINLLAIGLLRPLDWPGQMLGLLLIYSGLLWLGVRIRAWAEAGEA